LISSATVQWDSAITLAYAAEQLFAAAQLLTSDIVPWNRALRIAHERHLAPLLENERFLPERIRDRLLEAQRSYLRAKSAGITREYARQLASELMSILNDTSTMLNNISGPSWAHLGPQAA
jgi:hypothetical protein